MIDVKSSQPGGLNIETLEAPRPCPRSAASRGRIVNAVSTPENKSMGHLIGKAEPRLDGVVEGVII